MVEKDAAELYLKLEIEKAEKEQAHHESEAARLKRKISDYRATLRHMQGHDPPAKSLKDHIIIILKKHGRSNLKVIQTQLEAAGVKTDRQTLTGVLSRYVRAGKFFRRPEPSTFELIEENNESEKQ